MNSIIMNPPFSASWNQKMDERFENYGLAPKTKADYAFLLHGYSKLEDGSTMAIVLPHGVLFRGAAEGKIRKKLLEEGAIKAIVGLPANIFFGTQIPTVLIVLEKGRQDKSVLFIDASNDFTKGKNQNVLEANHIDKILDVYHQWRDIEKYAHVATADEIAENDFNLNIPRYVDTFEEEEPIDIVKLSAEILEIDRQIEENENNFLMMLDELTGDEAVIDATKSIFTSKRCGQLDLFR
ncbi:N-6 DNA methylase [Enterococcus mediterraneensis]|uniref:N-6 DNA methylase n=1 Tax=Enterococcus mediterraneensis TaxID=2364791 RepID=UPI001F14FE47|nr:N-6 DNA methylase [Enterococcus mediterraneensis]